jgi:hypothetical protein
LGLLNRAEFVSVRRDFSVALGSVERKGYVLYFSNCFFISTQNYVV